MTNLDANLKRMGHIAMMVLIGIGLLLIVLEFLFNRYGKIELEGLFLFPVVFGFVATVVIVVVGIGIRALLSRGEDYYDD